MDLRKLKTLIDLVSESDIAELEVTEGDGKVRIVKSTAYPQNPQVMMMPQQMMPAQAPVSAAPVAPLPVTPSVEAPVVPEGYLVKSPMVGTFYRSSAPGSAPFVIIGSSVKEGETLCLIEAMKLLNEIEAEVSGVITQILVENGQPIEYGQPLFVIG
ncbi:MAG: acetyl-CoA carboxylase biotin carboxyl carrier protein [Burkholderiaceae bacterium]